MVRKAGLEPAWLAPPPPQDGVSANSTTSALKAGPTTARAVVWTNLLRGVRDQLADRNDYCLGCAGGFCAGAFCVGGAGAGAPDCAGAVCFWAGFAPSITELP